MRLITAIKSFYRISKPSKVMVEEAQQERKFRIFGFQSFLAGTIGYSLYYVCRTSLNVVKKPIIDSGMIDASQLGLIGSVLLFAYAIGKFVNGFLADHCNIKRFMATGLLVSAVANFILGILGFASGSLPAVLIFTLFAIMWGINGWSQSMGSPPAIIALSRWLPLSKRGTFYGFFSLSHNLGEWLSFLFVGILVSVAGWQWGFIGSSLAGVIGVIVIIFFLHDNPQSKGLPRVEDMYGEVKEEKKQESTGDLQKMVLKTPAVWILAAASAFMYVARYAINGWGVLFLQEEKGFSLTQATTIISINALLGILGTVLSGWVSDKLFKSDRYLPALIFGIMNSLSLFLFLLGGDSLVINIIAMVFFGISIGVLICFLGGLMAVDIVPRKATGAALGVVGMSSYVAAGIQDVASGWLIDTNKAIVEVMDQTTGQLIQVTQYDFTPVAIFWIVASVISFILPIFNWKYRK
ncbi:MAG: MFS transporter [Bacteroidetes bacterium]|uniref:MFS transporter n=1 Tax=Candidatus Cryptobacteroides intestinigallinarum TaxID=2840767 RepID=A0A9D9HJM3_9BACT|nr:MFS transporter [Candidatus Cryptobacteroides intestinigallinarum]